MRLELERPVELLQGLAVVSRIIEHDSDAGDNEGRERAQGFRREILAAEALSPLSPFIVTCVGIVLYYAGDYREALKQFDRALELQPHFHLAHWHRGWAAAEL